MKKLRSRFIAVLILLIIPLLFFFYYKKKIDAIPKRAKNIPVLWEAPSFKYATQFGDSLSSDSLKGSIYVADFIFTSCASVCPELSKTMAQIQQNFVDNPEIKLISFSIDPIRDSIPALKDYADRYGAVKGKWYFLRGDTSAVWKMAEEGFKVPVVFTPEGGLGNEFTHTERIALVDVDGKVRGLYNGTDPAQMDSLYNNIGMLIVERRNL
jgi:protein SCO1/2